MFDSAPVLGIDPGLSRCGFGVVARGPGGSVQALRCGVMRTDPALDLPRRLADLADDIEALVLEVRPGVMVVERVLFQVNARSAISVGQASGLALATAARHGVPVVQYSPNEVKLAIAGDGAAGKAEVAAMVTRLLRLREVPKPADATDALALAVCHAWRARTEPLGSTVRTDQSRAEASTGPNDRLAASIAAAQRREGAQRRRVGAGRPS